MMFDVKNFSTDDLKKMQGLIGTELSQRQLRRKDELWNNVVKAMKEYCKEFDHFEIYCDSCNHCMEVEFNSYESKDAGELTLIDDEEWDY